MKVLYVAIARDTNEFEVYVRFRFRFVIVSIRGRSCLSPKLWPHPQDADDTEPSNKNALIFW